jgi:hypothetical protein
MSSNLSRFGSSIFRRVQAVISTYKRGVAEGWRIQHVVWTVQHTSVREAVHELKTQTAILANILEMMMMDLKFPPDPFAPDADGHR